MLKSWQMIMDLFNFTDGNLCFQEWVIKYNQTHILNDFTIYSTSTGTVIFRHLVTVFIIWLMSVSLSFPFYQKCADKCHITQVWRDTCVISLYGCFSVHVCNLQVPSFKNVFTRKAHVGLLLVEDPTIESVTVSRGT